ncbi:MAG: hypothetical protein ISS79_03135 [Phycisphaerae bacterium]|nr:hypothetical protein [Phycisphaerae bacterium]
MTSTNSLVEPLSLRQSEDGKWQVQNAPDNWITCETEEDAKVISNAPIVLHKSYEAIRPDESLAAELEKTAEKLEQYTISFGSRFFGRRAELMRGDDS